MKKRVPLLLALAVLVLLSGCSSMLKAMGGVPKTEYDKLALDVANLKAKMEETKAAADKAVQEVGTKATLAQLEALQAELGALKAELNSVKAELAKAELTAEELAKIKAKVEELSSAYAAISDATLLKLAEIIRQALTQATEVPAQAPATTGSPVSTEPAK
ncbi:MAG TPA: hypothetical protein VIO60_04775 [Rectinemataceae bacterium]